VGKKLRVPLLCWRKGLTTIEARNIEGELGASIKRCAIQRLARGGGPQVKLVALRLALETVIRVLAYAAQFF
jgi:hypothetical protein